MLSMVTSPTSFFFNASLSKATTNYFQRYYTKQTPDYKRYPIKATKALLHENRLIFQDGLNVDIESNDGEGQCYKAAKEIDEYCRQVLGIASTIAFTDMPCAIDHAYVVVYASDGHVLADPTAKQFGMENFIATVPEFIDALHEQFPDADYYFLQLYSHWGKNVQDRNNVLYRGEVSGIPLGWARLDTLEKEMQVEITRVTGLTKQEQDYYFLMLKLNRIKSFGRAVLAAISQKQEQSS
jgi:hypothetical protein